MKAGTCKISKSARRPTLWPVPAAEGYSCPTPASFWGGLSILIIFGSQLEAPEVDSSGNSRWTQLTLFYHLCIAFCDDRFVQPASRLTSRDCSSVRNTFHFCLSNPSKSRDLTPLDLFGPDFSLYRSYLSWLVLNAPRVVQPSYIDRGNMAADKCPERLRPRRIFFDS